MKYSLGQPKWASAVKHVQETPFMAKGSALAHEGEGEIATWQVKDVPTADRAWLTFDLLVHSTDMAVFRLRAWEDDPADFFELHFSVLARALARVRIPSRTYSQARWRLPREGAWLKPTCYGSRIAPDRITGLALDLLRTSSEPVRWDMTLPVFQKPAPQRLIDAPLSDGALVDEFGQSRHRNWPGKTLSTKQLTTRIQDWVADHHAEGLPASMNKWGGWAGGPQLKATGYFRTAQHDGRWWLVDPSGCLFWSTGLDCVRPSIPTFTDGLKSAIPVPEGDRELFETYSKERHREGHLLDHLKINWHRAFGADWKEKWDAGVCGWMRQTGFNTVANWSDTAVASRHDYPYVVPMAPSISKTPMIFRDLPDVFAASFPMEAETFAQALKPHAEDPCMIGYFMMNEPTWGFAAMTPAEGMLAEAGSSASREAFIKQLRDQYEDEAALQAAWKCTVTYEDLRSAPLSGPWSTRAQVDFDAFSGQLAERFFGVLAEACRKVAPHHLNLGIRYFRNPPDWCRDAMQCFDVFSINCYQHTVPSDEVEAITASLGMPVIVGEWHFGALDVGLPGSGIAHVSDQADRGRAYRRYLEQAAALPGCVGVHYFTLYDEHCLGRFDGENWNIGFFDICQRAYQELAEAARLSHEEVYAIASGQQAPADDAPDYLPRLFC